MVTVRESEVDGVPCFWVETGRPTLAASLLFRQGQADEPLHESGWLHLLEHMALHGAGAGSLSINGSVSALVTSFDAHGPAAAVAAHLTTVATWLGDPDLRRVGHEKGVLRAESGLRGGPLVGSFRWRYGTSGPGVGSYSEPGLARADSDRLRERCRRVFTRGNAVLVLDGPPPRSLRLRMADGPFLPPRPVASVESRFPAAYEEPGGLVLTGVVERSHEATIAAAMLGKAVRDEVRNRAGAAYAPWSSYEAVDANTAVVAAGSDLLPELLPRILASTLALVDRLKGGVPGAWVREEVDARLQALHDPYNAMGIAMRAGHAALTEQVPPSFEETVAELEGTDQARVNIALRDVLSTLLIGAPAGAKLPQGLRVAGYPRTPPAREARGNRHRNWPRDRTRFAAGPTGFEVVEGRHALRVSRDEVAALMTWQDGTRHVIGRDGWGLTMAPGAWHGGATLTRALDELVPLDLHLPLEGEGSRGLRRLSWTKRWSAPLRRAVTSAPGLALVAVVFALIGIAASTTQSGVVTGSALLVAVLCLLGVPRAFLRGRRRLW